MNGLTTGQAVQNLGNLINGSRLLKEEYDALQQSLQLLQQKAAELDGQAEAGKAAKKIEIRDDTDE